MNGNRRFLFEALRSGLDLGTITAEDVLRHVTPEVLAHHLPVTHKAQLLEASLAAEKMTPALVVATLGAECLGEHSPVAALWACINDCARRMLDDDDVSGALGPLEGGEPRPSRTARAPAVRPPARISALSPRSRTAPPPPRNGSSGVSEDLVRGSATDAEGSGSRPAIEFDLGPNDPAERAIASTGSDDETRPGEIDGSRKPGR